MWLDPLVKREREAGVAVEKFAVHEELLHQELAMKNPEVRWNRLAETLHSLT